MTCLDTIVFFQSLDGSPGSPGDSVTEL